MGTHDQLAGARPSVFCEGVRVACLAESTGMLITETFRLGFTPVYVNGLGVHAKRVAGTQVVGLDALIYSKASPKNAPGKALQRASRCLHRAERESAIQKKQNRAW